MDKALNELTGILRVSREGLQAIFQEIGLNYREVYEVLAREQAIESVVGNLFGVAFLATGLLVTSMFIVSAERRWMNESTFKLWIKLWKIAVPILFVAWVLLSLTPLLTPNLNLIQNLLDK